MDGSGALATMPPKNAKGRGEKGKRPVGRPPEVEQIRSLVSLKGTDELEKWVDELVDFDNRGTRTLLMRVALKEYGQKIGFPKPMPAR